MSVPEENQTYRWGFLFENVHFTPFDSVNNQLIEMEYQARGAHYSHNIDIVDSNLKYPAKIYFGVAQTHLRMPGTRYYVQRREIKIQSPTVAPAASPMAPAPSGQHIAVDQMYYAIPMGVWTRDELSKLGLGAIFQTPTLSVQWQECIAQLYQVSATPINLLDGQLQRK
ncbi:hypothetical protein BC943DRAFT_318303 [Umbelopsis sp. AD052]|nr:hypothetical protein BC943DRAFT_318303 [Umbelopsis sp. AD052]